MASEGVIYRLMDSLIIQYKELAHNAVSTRGRKSGERFPPLTHMTTTYANMEEMASLVVLMKCQVKGNRRHWFSFVRSNPVFQSLGNCSTADTIPTTAHIMAITAHIMLLLPYPSTTPFAP